MAGHSKLLNEMAALLDPGPFGISVPSGSNIGPKSTLRKVVTYEWA